MINSFGKKISVELNYKNPNPIYVERYAFKIKLFGKELKMTKENAKTGRLTRIETYLEMAQSGQEVGLEVKLHKEIIKQSLLTDEADNLRIEKDIYLLMADYIPKTTLEEPNIVSKVYAFGTINENDVEERTIRLIANERLQIDYDRLRDAGVDFQEAEF
jgi:hypothetical protein